MSGANPSLVPEAWSNGLFANFRNVWNPARGIVVEEKQRWTVDPHEPSVIALFTRFYSAKEMGVCASSVRVVCHLGFYALALPDAPKEDVTDLANCAFPLLPGDWKLSDTRLRKIELNPWNPGYEFTTGNHAGRRYYRRAVLHYDQ